jgi:hypothetical protein
MTSTSARRPKSPRTSGDTTPTRKATAYGREVLRVVKEMQKLGPWDFGPRISDRVFTFRRA